MRHVVVAVAAVASLVSNAQATCGPGPVVTYVVDLARKSVRLTEHAQGRANEAEVDAARKQQAIDLAHDLGVVGAHAVAVTPDRWIVQGDDEIVLVDLARRRPVWRHVVPAGAGPALVLNARIAFGVIDWKAKKIGIASLSTKTGTALPSIMGAIGTPWLYRDPVDLVRIDATHVELHALDTFCTTL